VYARIKINYYRRRCKTSLFGQSTRLSVPRSPVRRVDSGQNSKIRELKSTFEHIELSAKLLDYFLKSKKSNGEWVMSRVHQPCQTCSCVTSYTWVMSLISRYKSGVWHMNYYTRDWVLLPLFDTSCTNTHIYINPMICTFMYVYMYLCKYL